MFDDERLCVKVRVRVCRLRVQAIVKRQMRSAIVGCSVASFVVQVAVPARLGGFLASPLADAPGAAFLRRRGAAGRDPSALIAPAASAAGASRGVAGASAFGGAAGHAAIVRLRSVAPSMQLLGPDGLPIGDCGGGASGGAVPVRLETF